MLFVSEERVLRGERVILRPAAEDDLQRFAEILASPDVSRWWGAPLRGAALRNYVLGADDLASFAIEMDGQIVGLLQYHEEAEPGYRSAGMDIAIATEFQGRGLGQESLRTMARYLFEQRGHHRLTIDPAAANSARSRAIEALASGLWA